MAGAAVANGAADRGRHTVGRDRNRSVPGQGHVSGQLNAVVRKDRPLPVEAGAGDGQPMEKDPFRDQRPFAPGLFGRESAVQQIARQNAERFLVLEGPPVVLLDVAGTSAEVGDSG